MPEANPRAVIGNNAPPPIEKILEERYADLDKRKKAWIKKAGTAVLTPKTEAEIQALETLFADGDAIAKDAEKARVVEKEEPLKLGKAIDTFFNGGFRDKISALADPIKKAALTRRAEIAEAAKKKAADEAAALAKKAAEDEAKAEAARSRGENKLAEVYENRSDAKMNEAAGAQAIANQDVREISRSTAGGVSSSAGFKMVCTAVNKAELDLNALRLVLKEADLIDAVNRLMAMGNPAPTGAIVERQVAGTIRRRS